MRALRNRDGVRRGLSNVVMSVATPVSVSISVATMRIGRCVQRGFLVRMRCRFALHFVSVYFVRGT
jgi:hypothetical protein